jgi:hypothetical protein
MNENKKFKVWWDDKEKIVRSYVIGDHDEKLAMEYEKEIRKLVAGLQAKGAGKINSIFDATRVGNASSKARKIYADWIKEGKNRKVAIFGAGLVQRTVANFIFAFANKKNTVKFFETEKEALEWLKD